MFDQSVGADRPGRSGPSVCRSRSRTAWRRSVVAVVGAVALSSSFILSAQAALPTDPLPGSSFEGGDGNLTVGVVGHTDWANVSPNVGIDLPSGTGDNSFGQGTKEDNALVTVVAGSIPPNKNDLTRFYEASSTGTNGHIFLNLAWERLVNIGNANLDFEINHAVTTGWGTTTTGAVTINRTAGDLLVTYDFGGSGTPTLGVNQWVTSGATSQCLSSSSLPCWGNRVVFNNTDAQGAVNTVAVTDPLASNASLGVGLFGEAALDLTAAGIFPAGSCQHFGSAFVKSRSSSSFTAEIKDFIAPIPININNCSSITVKKVTQNEPTPGTQSFGYSTTGGLSPSTFSLTGGGTPRVYSNLNAGSYSVTEGAEPTGWNAVSLVCTSDATPNGASTSGVVATIALKSGENVVCTYTNHFTNSPTIATTLSASTVFVGQAMHDSATLSGTSAVATGTVTYHAYAGANTCPADFSGDLLNSQVTVGANNAVPNSADFTPTAAGTYSFQAVYSGDANNNGASSVCSTEQLVVNRNATTTVTTPSDGSGTALPSAVALGTSLFDKAVVTGNAFGGTPTGTVDFTVCTPAQVTGTGSSAVCAPGTGTALTGNPRTLAGTGTTSSVLSSPAVVASSAGLWCFRATYTPTGNAYLGSSDGSHTECVTVNPDSTTTVTTPQVNGQPISSAIAVNTSVTDHAVVTGTAAGGAPTGTVNFFICNPTQVAANNGTCSSGGTAAGSVAVATGANNASTADSTPVTATVVGTWCFRAEFVSNTASYTNSSDSSTGECFTVHDSTSATSAQEWLPNDSATIASAGGTTLNGTLSFTLFPGTACTGTALRSAETVTLTNEASGTTHRTTNTDVKVSASSAVSWLVTFTSTDPLVTGSSHCESTSLTITN